MCLGYRQGSKHILHQAFEFAHGGAERGRRGFIAEPRGLARHVQF